MGWREPFCCMWSVRSCPPGNGQGGQVWNLGERGVPCAPQWTQFFPNERWKATGKERNKQASRNIHCTSGSLCTSPPTSLPIWHSRKASPNTHWVWPLRPYTTWSTFANACPTHAFCSYHHSCLSVLQILQAISQSINSHLSSKISTFSCCSLHPGSSQNVTFPTTFSKVTPLHSLFLYLALFLSPTWRDMYSFAVCVT